MLYIPTLEKFPDGIHLNRKISISKIRFLDRDGKSGFPGENQLFVCELTDLDNGVFKGSDNIAKIPKGHSEHKRNLVLGIII